MKKILILLVLTTSCMKDDITPIIVEEQPSQQVTTYQNGGVLPSWSQTPSNVLVGTNWVLTKIVDNFVITTINDTLHFISDREYYINSNVNHIGKYLLYNSQNNVTLTFEPLFSKNSVVCTTNELGFGFENYGEIIGITFNNQYNYSNPFKSWFHKL